MAQVDGAWPEVSITREGILEKALDLVGLGDIELESEEFNRRFALRSPDRRFAVTLVDARMIDFLLSTEARFAFFVKGRWVLLVSDPVRPRLVPALMRVARDLRGAHPACGVRAVAQPVPRRRKDARWRPATRPTALAVAAAEQAEGSPWSGARARRRTTRSRTTRPEYDLDGNVVEEHARGPVAVANLTAAARAS